MKHVLSLSALCLLITGPALAHFGPEDGHIHPHGFEVLFSVIAALAVLIFVVRNSR